MEAFCCLQHLRKYDAAGISVITNLEQMAEAFVSVILEQLTTILFEEARQEVKLVTGVGKEIDKLKSNFESIHALLDDAEEKQIKERSIRLWLDRLKDVCYDMEDVLDEWMTALLKMQLDRSNSARSKGKVCLPSVMPCFCFGKVVQRRYIALRIREINERVDGIVKQKDSFSLAPREINRNTRRVETTAFAEVLKLHGRDEVKQQLVTCLLCGSSNQVESDVKTVSVVGMGGMGKTALAQLIYNNADVDTHFTEKIWVCVSEDLDECGIAKVVLKSLDSNSTQNPDSLPLHNLLERIRESVEGKKVFLVLDDVWKNGRKIWEVLKQAFMPACESRILVTTRDVTVAKDMESFHVFRLEELSDDVCWKILRQEAFSGKDEQLCKALEETGRKIAEKCKGLPLTAKTLGSMLRYKETRREWENVLNSEIWKFDIVQKDVFAPLLLSFYELPSAIRRCFLYCSVFPKDHLFRRDDLISRWMAQGYLNSTENAELEETGVHYFECLVARSFFQDLQRFEDDEVGECKMHDTVVDFARFLMGNEFYVLKEHHNSEEGNLRVEILSEKTRHLLVVWEKDKTYALPKMGSGEENKLRSATIVKSSQDLCNLCIQPKHLRSLDFIDSRIVEFPEDVGKLMHLRLLNLSGSYFLKKLPESICELYNLQSLYLRRCDTLENLPNKMEKLINLRCLDATYCVSLKSFPKGISRLTSLRYLGGVVVKGDCNNDEEFSLGDLENLSNLRCLKHMRIIGCKIDANEARRANLHSKIHLRDLEIVKPDETMDEDDVIRVLNLPLHTNVSFTSWGGILMAIKFALQKTILQYLKDAKNQ